MKKIIYFPLWNIETIEKQLHDYELNGWRLNNVQYSYIFDFVKSKPKSTNYIITYSMAKDYTTGMYEYDRMLLNDYHANKIPNRFTCYNFYRITEQNRDLSDLKKYRRKYFKHTLFQYLLISLFFLIVGLFMLIVAKKQQITNLQFVLIVIYTIVSALFFVYRIYGYIKQTLKK